jgi:hypothetical protein
MEVTERHQATVLGPKAILVERRNKNAVNGVLMYEGSQERSL